MSITCLHIVMCMYNTYIEKFVNYYSALCMKYTSKLVEIDLYVEDGFLKDDGMVFVKNNEGCE